MEIKKLFRYPLNIQLFAEGNGDGEGNGSTPQDNHESKETPSKEAYEKLKNEFDKTASELAKIKREQKAKMSEDEKLKAEQQEREAHYQELERKVLKSDMQNELINSGLDNKSISKILDEYFKDEKPNVINLCKIIAQEVSSNIKTIKEQAKDEFQRSSTLPPSGDSDKKDQFIQGLIKSNSNKSSNNARDYYLNKNIKK